MASEGKYMAYVGSYSYNGKAKGITVYDVDVEKGTFKERCEVEVDNSSYVTASNDNRTLCCCIPDSGERKPVPLKQREDQRHESLPPFHG